VKKTIKVVTPTEALIKGGYAHAIRDWFETDSTAYDAKYSVSKIDIAAALQREVDLYGEEPTSA
jgi:hypothetical protein